jgi:predicted ATPase
MTNKTDIPKYTGFKLISLDLRDTTLMGKSKLFYSFIEPNDEQKSIYTTVIIGANGTGKSNLFRIIIELFKELEDLSKGKNRSYDVDGRFSLKFSLNDDEYEYSNIKDSDKLKDIHVLSEKGNTAYLLRNGQKEDFAKVQLPIAIVANSIMLTDKYPFFRKETNAQGEKVDAFQRYKYLGIRNIAQNASTRAYVRKTVEFINQEFKSIAFRKGLERATTFLGLEQEIDIYYYTSNNAKFFRGNLTQAGLDEYFEEIRKNYPKPEDNPPFKLNQYHKIKEDKKLVQEICDFCNDLVISNRLVKPGYRYSSIRKIIYNLIDPKSFEKLNEEYSMLEHLRQLGMISPPEIELKRVGGYSLQESSSGEYHFFSSIVGLMATVKTNSIVFIDEPEISLHPNWQMKYLTFIRELFDSPEYATSHIFVATHSHFLLSDLRGESSKIIGLKRENGKIEIVELPKDIDTFGWSTEDVLYKVFGVRTTRNYYMEVDLRELLHSISEQKNNKDELQKIIARLEKVKLNGNDPLNVILDKAKAYIEKI